MIELNKIFLGDCLKIMNDINDKSIDMILCDLPFEVTNNPKDIIIPLVPLWDQYNRIIKDNGAIVLFGQGMFTAKLMMENKKMWRYNLIYKKGNRVSGFLNANRQPLRNHEDILLFYKHQPCYNPIFTKGKPLHSKGKNIKKDGINNNYGKYDTSYNKRAGTTQKYPQSILNFKKPHPAIHPNEKPVLLLEYLIKTYSNENEIILDNACGSGSTCVAAKNTNRFYIGIDNDQKWVDMTKKRLK